MKDWLNDIHDKLGDFETKAPEGLWAKLEASQPAPLAGKGGSAVRGDDAGKVAPLILWGRRIAGLGAAAAVVLAGVLLFRHDTSNDNFDIVANVQEGSVQTITGYDLPTRDEGYLAENGVVMLPKESKTSVLGHEMTTGLEVTPMDAECQEVLTAVSDPEESLGYQAEEKSVEVRTYEGDDFDRPQTFSRTEDGRHSHSRKNDRAKSDNKEMGRKDHAMSIGIINTLGTQSSNTLAFAGPSMTIAGPDENAVWDDSPMLGAMLFSRGVGEAKFTHRMPVRVGVTLDWQLARRWFLESGLTYTRLSSTIRQGDEENYTSANQKLDYIGIPLNVKFKAFGTPNIGLYVSAGMNMDKCVSASRSGSYRFAGIGGSESGDLGTEKYDERPLQLSANLAAGASFIISPLISIYAEPGISYYFDDKSSLDTIYKDRPLNFSMNMGLRFTLTHGR